MSGIVEGGVGRLVEFVWRVVVVGGKAAASNCCGHHTCEKRPHVRYILLSIPPDIQGTGPSVTDAGLANLSSVILMGRLARTTPAGAEALRKALPEAESTIQQERHAIMQRFTSALESPRLPSSSGRAKIFYVILAALTVAALTIAGCEKEASVFERRYVLVSIPGFQLADYIELLDHRDPNLRYLGVANLLALEAFASGDDEPEEEDKALAEKMKSLLSDPAPKVRAIAAYTIAQRDDPGTAALLAAMLNDKSDPVRVEALAGLADQNETNAQTTDRIVESIQDANTLVRLHALEALAAGCSQERKEAVTVRLIEFMPQRELAERLKIAETLGALKTEQAEKVLLKMLRSGDSRIVDAAAMGLAEIASPAAEEAALQALEDAHGSPHMLLALISVVATEKSLNPVIARLGDESPEIQAWCREILGASGNKRALTALITRMSMLQPKVESRLEFPEATNDTDVQEFLDLLAQIEKIGEELSLYQFGAKGIKSLMNSPNLHERLIGMARLRDEDVFDRDLLGVELGRVDFFTPLAALSEDKSALARAAAFETLAHSIDPKVAPLMLKGVGDSVFEVRLRALEAIVRYSQSTGNLNPLLELYAIRETFVPVTYQDDDAGFVLREALETAVSGLEPSWVCVTRLMRDLAPSKPAPTRLLAASHLCYLGHEDDGVPVLLAILESGSSAERNFALDAVNASLNKGHLARLNAILDAETNDDRREIMLAIIEDLTD